MNKKGLLFSLFFAFFVCTTLPCHSNSIEKVYLCLSSLKSKLASLVHSLRSLRGEEYKKEEGEEEGEEEKKITIPSVTWRYPTEGEKGEVGGPHGLRNYGSCCFMNAAMQCLRVCFYNMTPEERTEFAGSKGSLRHEVAKFFKTKQNQKNLWYNIRGKDFFKDFRSLNPTGFARSKDSSIFINHFFTHIKDKEGYSFDLFILKNHLYPKNGLYERIKIDKLILCDIPIRMKSIEQGIQDFLQINSEPEKEELQAAYEVFPKFLILRCELKDNLDKEEVLIPTPLGDYKYEVIGFTINLGQFHYTAHVKYDNQYFKCNDSSVTPISNLEGYLNLGTDITNLIVLKQIGQPEQQEIRIVEKEIKYVEPEIRLTDEHDEGIDDWISLAHRNGKEVFAEVKEVRQCPECNAYLKYIQKNPNNSKFVRCSNLACNHRFCWICGEIPSICGEDTDYGISSADEPYHPTD